MHNRVSSGPLERVDMPLGRICCRQRRLLGPQGGYFGCPREWGQRGKIIDQGAKWRDHKIHSVVWLVMKGVCVIEKAEAVVGSQQPGDG